MGDLLPTPLARKAERALLGLACTLVLATTSCSGDGKASSDPAPVPGGPIILGGSLATSCIAPPDGVADLTYGLESLAPEDDVNLEIDDVKIAEPKNLEIVEAFFLTGQDALIGNHSSWPPPADVIASDFEAAWGERQPAKGMDVDYSPDGGQAGLVLHLRRENPEKKARFKNIEVAYVADEVHYLAESTIAFEAKRKC